jgi:ribosomal protein S27AE
MELKKDIKCPNCGRMFTIKVRDMVPGRKDRCPNCGAGVSFTGADGRKVQRALDDLQRTLKKLSR